MIDVVPKVLRNFTSILNRFHSSPKIVCIYFLCLEGELVYIGETNSLVHRILQHLEQKDFDAIYYLELLDDDKPSRVELETLLINYFKPTLNRGYSKTKTPPFSEIQKKIKELSGDDVKEGVSPVKYREKIRKEVFKEYREKLERDLSKHREARVREINEEMRRYKALVQGNVDKEVAQEVVGGSMGVVEYRGKTKQGKVVVRRTAERLS